MTSIADLKPFEEIADIASPLQLECFGGIYTQHNDPTSPVVECLLTPISDLEKRYDYRQQIQTEIAVGYLPALYAGQRFEHGLIVAPKSWQKSHDLTIDIDLISHPPEETTFDLLEPQLSAPPIKRGHYETVRSSGLKVLKAQIAASSSGAARISELKTVIIQEIELIRFYYCTSSKLTETIFNGGLCNEDWLNTICNQIHEKPSLNTNTGQARFVHRHSYTDADAPVLARIIFDESKQALRSAQRVFQTRQANQVNASRSIDVSHPRTLFPTHGKITLKVRGVWKQLRKANEAESQQYAFLVQRILDCSSPFPFRHLSYANELSPDGIPAGPEAPTAFKQAQRSSSGASSNSGLSRSKERPSILSALMELKLSARNFSGLDPSCIVKEKLRDCTHRGADTDTGTTKQLLPNVSTGQGTYGASTSKRLLVSDIPTAPTQLSAGLEAFLKIVDQLKLLQPGWQITLIDAGARSIDGRSCTLPKVPCAKRKNALRKFSFIDDEKIRLRRFICAEIVVEKGLFFYVFEMERRIKAGEGNSIVYADELPIAVIYSHTFEALKKLDFSALLVQSIKQRTWALSSTSNALRKLDIKHADVNSTAFRLAKSIIGSTNETASFKS